MSWLSLCLKFHGLWVWSINPSLWDSRRFACFLFSHFFKLIFFKLHLLIFIYFSSSFSFYFLSVIFGFHSFNFYLFCFRGFLESKFFYNFILHFFLGMWFDRNSFCYNSFCFVIFFYFQFFIWLLPSTLNWLGIDFLDWTWV
jgi:hypothetical protein